MSKQRRGWSDEEIADAAMIVHVRGRSRAPELLEGVRDLAAQTGGKMYVFEAETYWDDVRAFVGQIPREALDDRAVRNFWLNEKRRYSGVHLIPTAGGEPFEISSIPPIVARGG